MNPDQSGTKPAGSTLPVVAGEDLTGKRSYLVEPRNVSGAEQFFLPDNIADDALFQLDEVGALGDTVDVRPLLNGEERRLVLKGTCVPGARLCLADVGTAADKGKVRAVPGTTGTYRPLAIARESGVDGQLVRAVVFVGLPLVVVP